MHTNDTPPAFTPPRTPDYPTPGPGLTPRHREVIEQNGRAELERLQGSAYAAAERMGQIMAAMSITLPRLVRTFGQFVTALDDAFGIPEPDACTACRLTYAHHGGLSGHPYAAPSDRVRLERMKLRRAARAHRVTRVKLP